MVNKESYKQQRWGDDGRGDRVLQCHSRGDKRFSPFFCSVRAFNRWDSIENHYQRSKVFATGDEIESWRDAKRLQKEGISQVSWQIGKLVLPVKLNDLGTNFAIDDWGVQWYIALWYKYLSDPNKEYLINIAKEYTEYQDIFEESFPFSQARVFRTVAKDSAEGVAALLPYCKPLMDLLKGEN